MQLLHIEERLKKAKKLIVKLNAGFVLVVEGKRDEAALANVGITCKIIQANGKAESVVKRIAATGLKPVVLFDFDSTGNEREKRLIELLLAYGVVPETSIRREFQRVFGLRFFEDVDTKYEEIKQSN